MSSNGVACTLIDNGMPCVVIAAADVGATGYESREELDAAVEGQGAHRGDPADRRAADELGRRRRRVVAEDDARRRAA